jgi:hypothetical protein
MRSRQTVGVHGTYDDDDDDDDDDDSADNKGKSVVIPDDIKGDYVKCLIIPRYYPCRDASWPIISPFLSRFSRGFARWHSFRGICACLLVIKSLERVAVRER